MSRLPWCSRFRYDLTEYDAVDFSLTWPSLPWDWSEDVLGGEAESGAGVIAAFTVRRDYLLLLPLHVTELEWPLIRALIEFGQTGEPVLWYPDTDDLVLSYYQVYLDAPDLGDKFELSANNDYPGVQLITLKLRRVDGAHWDGLPSYSRQVA